MLKYICKVSIIFSSVIWDRTSCSLNRSVSYEFGLTSITFLEPVLHCAESGRYQCRYLHWQLYRSREVHGTSASSTLDSHSLNKQCCQDSMLYDLEDQSQYIDSPDWSGENLTWYQSASLIGRNDWNAPGNLRHTYLSKRYTSKKYLNQLQAVF